MPGLLEYEVMTAEAGWRAIELAFGALGRAVLLLDGEFCVLKATASLDRMVCDEAASKIIGHPAADLLGATLFSQGSDLCVALERGEKQEGRRAFLQCRDGGARLASISANRIHAAETRYIVVIRPAEAESQILRNASGGKGLVADSPAMMGIVHLMEQLHRSDANLLVTGESGVGKEIVARAFHANSQRREGPFVAINCAAIPADLLESELFGHARGAFTGATADRVGRFEMARGGTLFLDEIGDMPAPLQVKLLRVLQDGTYTRVGENAVRELNARVMSATHVNLEAAIAAGNFREDLYYRLRVVPVHISPLRERVEDIEPLARRALSRIGQREGRSLILSPYALRTLERYRWPGNVRQLQNAIEYAVAMCRGQTVQVEHLPSEVETAQARAPGPDDEPRAGTAAPTTEAARIRDALERARWSRSRAAKLLGLSRTTLWRKMRELGIQ